MQRAKAPFDAILTDMSCLLSLLLGHTTRPTSKLIRYLTASDPSTAERPHPGVVRTAELKPERLARFIKITVFTAPSSSGSPRHPTFCDSIVSLPTHVKQLLSVAVDSGRRSEDCGSGGVRSQPCDAETAYATLRTSINPCRMEALASSWKRVSSTHDLKVLVGSECSFQEARARLTASVLMEMLWHNDAGSL
jgi:hypothetical protein